jgi:N-acetylglutamate synthase-like GNAT family acetyltransferase
MIRSCTEADLPAILNIINDAAQAYKGRIPDDCWQEPYMPETELREQLRQGVRFCGWEEGGQLQGVMGLQEVQDVTLIRHAYVRAAQRGKGLGSKLIDHLKMQTQRPVLIGTWAAAEWAVLFYERHGFRLLPKPEAHALLKKYWDIPQRQLETSVVLADQNWIRPQRNQMLLPA